MSLSSADTQNLNKKASRFTFDELVHAIKATGLKQSDTVIAFCSLLKLGRPILDGRELERFYLDAIFEVIADDGLLVLPAFSYSFCKHEQYDPKTTLSDVNVLSNYCIKHGIGVRSLDPNFSYIFLTKSDLYKETKSSVAHEIRDLKFSNVSFDCDEEPSIPRFLLSRNSRFLNLSAVPYCTLLHNVEQKLDVNTRYYKLFTGSIKRDNEVLDDVKIYYFCRKYYPNTEVDMGKLDLFFRQLESDTKHNAQITRVPIGKADILGGSIAGILSGFIEAFTETPYVVSKGPHLTAEQIDSVDDPFKVAVSEIERQLFNVVDLES